MDRILGGIIDDYTLYKIIEGAIAIFIMVAIYLGIQIVLTLKFIKNKDESPGEIIPQKDSFYRSTIFILIAGFFMLIHEFFEGLEKDAADYTTYEFFELLAVVGSVLFLYEWNKTLKKLKKK
ncbi:MAG TPA: hypothetical protein VIO58_07750 [Candidatus Methanoperedens sp.]